MPLPTTTLEGRLGADPELRFTPTGVAVATLSMVCNDRKRQDDGTWEDGEPFWIRVTAWRQLGENAVNSLHKGDLVIAVGKLKQRQFETREGQMRQVVELDAYDIGPSLKWTEAEIKQVDRRGPAESAPATSNPWDSPPPSTSSDEPPF